MAETKRKTKKEITQNVTNYDESAIEILEGLDAVRLRPGMYVGGTNEKALHHLIYEILDNSVDEALNGHGKVINLILHKDGSIEVADEGRGIPVGIKEGYGISALELLMTSLHSGGKFGQGGYKTSGGLHGVGLTVVNALSKWIEATVKRDGKIHHIRLDNQEVTKKLKVIGKTKETGSTIRFMPDEDIFDTIEFQPDVIKSRLKETAYLMGGIKLTFTDMRAENPKTYEYAFSGGISSYVEDLNKDKEPVHKKVLSFSEVKENFEVEYAFQYTSNYEEIALSYVNNVRTTDGGTHEQGLKTGLTKALNEVGRKQNILKAKDKNITGDDIREGLTYVMSVKIGDPKFEGQTKSKLQNSEVVGIMNSIAYEHFTRIFESNKPILTAIIKRAQLSAKNKESMKQTKELTKSKNTIDIEGLSSKFARCTTNNPDEAELYLVEGDSAGGSAKQGRNRYFQAILPLRGKIVNTEKATLAKILANEEIRTMINAIGAGVGKDTDPSASNYKKIIFMTDADVDGEHIDVLLLTFFYRFLRPLIEAGYIYLAMPPLYKIENGKNVYYVYNEKEKNDLLATLKGKVKLQRYKGLGEMNADQLWETTMDPEVRTLVQVTIEDAIYANETISMLMGDLVEPRRQFIEENALYASL